MMTPDLRQQIAAIKSPVLLLAAADFAPDAASRKQLASSYEAQVEKVPHARVVSPSAPGTSSCSTIRPDERIINPALDAVFFSA